MTDYGHDRANASGGTEGVAPMEDRVALAEIGFASFGGRLAAGRDALGDHLKAFERAEAKRAAPAGAPVCVRLDGKNFSGFTKPLARPYDGRMSLAMVETTRKLVEESGAVLGYTQSEVRPGAVPRQQERLLRAAFSVARQKGRPTTAAGRA